MTANGLGSPLVIKHMRQEEEEGGKPSQRDQWYWSMVSLCHRQWCWYFSLKIALSYNSTIKMSENFPGSWVGCCPALSSSCSKRGSSGKNKQMKHSILTNIWKYVKPKDQHAWEKLRFLWYLESTTTTCQTVSLTVWHDMYGMDIARAAKT